MIYVVYWLASSGRVYAYCLDWGSSQQHSAHTFKDRRPKSEDSMLQSCHIASLRHTDDLLAIAAGASCNDVQLVLAGSYITAADKLNGESCWPQCVPASGGLDIVMFRLVASIGIIFLVPELRLAFSAVWNWTLFTLISFNLWVNT